MPVLNFDEVSQLLHEVYGWLCMFDDTTMEWAVVSRGRMRNVPRPMH